MFCIGLKKCTAERALIRLKLHKKYGINTHAVFAFTHVLFKN